MYLSVAVRGQTLHACTENWADKHPVAISWVYLWGGNIVVGSVCIDNS